MNKKGVSAIIGVILMVAITVAIAATTYVYVAGMLRNEIEEPDLKGGIIIDKFRTFYPSENIKYFFTIKQTIINETCNCLTDIIFTDMKTDIHTWNIYSIGDVYNG